MSTHNICFCGEIRKILCGYPLLPVAMSLATQNVSCGDSEQTAQMHRPIWIFTRHKSEGIFSDVVANMISVFASQYYG